MSGRVSEWEGEEEEEKIVHSSPSETLTSSPSSIDPAAEPERLPPRSRRPNTRLADHFVFKATTDAHVWDLSGLLDDTEKHAFQVNTLPPIPQTFEEAMASPEKEHWLAAIHEELSGMIARHTWDVVRRPKNRAVVGCRWVFTRSQRKDGSIKRYKARLVAKGYSQRPGVDYDETWAPVKRIETLRILMALSVNKRSPTRHYDVTQAFLNGRLQKEIYMEPAPGFEEDQDTVCKLRQSIYGLKQAGRVWHEVLSEFLIGFGFERCSADICAFVLRKNEQTAILLSNVDDLYFLCPDDSVREQLILLLGLGSQAPEEM